MKTSGESEAESPQGVGTSKGDPGSPLPRCVHRPLLIPLASAEVAQGDLCDFH